MAPETVDPPAPIKKLCSRLGELLPQLQSTSKDDELTTDLEHLKAEGEKEKSEYTVPTHLRRIFSKLEPLKSSAAQQARELIQKYADGADIKL
jgi:hypothetical protein